ncbi:chain-length determining protein [Brevundimonas sp. Leaf168]|uniref:GumC family protein n=1 Tax=Brevundimonas sp. Leaf168 TaxID=1736283 RepID=UPI0006F83C2F|nr:chain-length determining protein [Brevundimonas sp. Leaf168]KQR61572.1 chain-length determining protein [Brevundimonas sp. Leaf168]
MRSTAHVTTRPRYGVLDVIGLLFRELLLMIVVFVVILGLGFAAAMTLKKSYTATGSVFAGVGQEYVYQPRVGTAERGQAPQGDEVANSEAAILGSSAVRQKVVEALGPAAILGEPPKGSPQAARSAALKTVGGGLGVATAPGSAVIHLTYKADDPERAARVLNTIIEQYLIYRREVFQDKTPAIASQRIAFEDELSNADRAYEAFLASNDIGDFTAAKATLAATYQTVFTDRMSTQSQLNQTAQRLNTLVAQQAGTPAEVALQQDLNISAQDQVLQLRTEREQLLSRYQPDAQPVKDIEARINQLQAYVATGKAVGAKEVRTGPNPVWTELETTRINTRAERDSLAARLTVLDRQLADIRSRQARLTALESENTTLAGNREVLSASIREFQQRETQSRADNALVAAGADNVTVIERAQPPATGKSLKIPLLAAVFLFAGFTALCVGLLRVFTRRGFTTPASVSRTLDMPVLAVAPAKAA